MKRIYYFLFMSALFVLNSCQKNESIMAPQIETKSSIQKSTVATDWYRMQLRILLERNSALNGAYFGYVGVGLYEAVRNIDNSAKSLSGTLTEMPAMPQKQNDGYSWEISANAYLAAIIKSLNTGLTPANLSSIDSLENAYNEKLKPAMPSAVFSRSQSFGRDVAKAIHDWYLTDDFNPSNAGFVPKVFPGAWVPTPPAFANGVNPYIGTARTFMASNKSILAPPPLAYSEDPNSDFYKMVKQVYDVSLTLTTDQKNTALYWIDQGNGTGYTPPGHDMFIITEAIEQSGASLLTAAEVYAKTAIAEHDATITCFRSKYEYSLIRPVSYIQKLIDPNWLPFITTPPHPEYPAAHAYITGAVMEAASKVLGDNVSVTDHAYDFRGWAPRTFSTLFAAAENAGISRLYGGIHYLNSINEGLVLGKELGDEAGSLQLH